MAYWSWLFAVSRIDPAGCPVVGEGWESFAWLAEKIGPQPPSLSGR